MSCREDGLKMRTKLIQDGKIKGKVYVSFSGGKDSTAMLLKLKEKNVKFDKIVFADTLLEYPELYMYIDYFRKEYPDLNISVLKPKTFKAKELFDKNNLIYEKLISKGFNCIDPKKIYPSDWKEDTVISLWDFWFYGIVGRGENKGTVRGYPLTLGGCWYKREAKVNPLNKAMKNADIIYVGIASDEIRRQGASNEVVKHPLVEFGLSEDACAKFLQEKGLHNPIYDKYNRSGCYNCPRQNHWGLYMLWKNSPDLWDKTKHYDNEGRRVRGQGGFIDYKTKKEIVLQELEEKFRSGFIPDKNLKFECQSCSMMDVFKETSPNNEMKNMESD